MTEELQTQPQPQPQATMQPQPKARLGPQDYRNSELVTKFMAANPPYLYSPAVGPHNFFFSEMLRSLVANKRNESLRNASEQLHHQQQQQHQHQQQQHHQAHAQAQHVQSQLALQAASTRRPRKRSWSQHRYYPEVTHKEGKDGDDRPATHPEKPLELTNKLAVFNSRNIPAMPGGGSVGTKLFPDEPPEPGCFKTPAYHERKQSELKPAPATVPEKPTINNSSLLPEPSAGSMPPSDLILPPPPPVWYPPLYPPYGIDPLHFFIDLRVSGHIYDRKKESNSPGSGGSEGSTLSVKSEHSKLIGTGGDRQGSAFSVPKPRDTVQTVTGTAGAEVGPSAINLATPLDEGGQGVDANEGEHRTTDAHQAPAGFGGDTKNAHYVLHNLPRIYGDLNGNHKMADGRCLVEDEETNGNLSDEQEQDPEPDSKSIGSIDDATDEENKYRDVDLNVISDEESIAVDEN
ncbi:uncharacterized protein LOC126581332 [Anopheles aquasalis]|uniref:uncharacterized protein LOC126581332 n=1 Tax=Anopheles aquasalis TaxID=42839 RepID=UPI00215A807F|nr:uncharacterized protein LOC126581332 [Anopheles aquasalis]